MKTRNKMNLPRLPDSCQSSGRVKSNTGAVFEGIASIASIFNKINKNNKYTEKFLKTSGMSGKLLYKR